MSDTEVKEVTLKETSGRTFAWVLLMIVVVMIIFSIGGIAIGAIYGITDSYGLSLLVGGISIAISVAFLSAYYTSMHITKNCTKMVDADPFPFNFIETQEGSEESPPPEKKE